MTIKIFFFGFSHFELSPEGAVPGPMGMKPDNSLFKYTDAQILFVGMWDGAASLRSIC